MWPVSEMSAIPVIDEVVTSVAFRVWMPCVAKMTVNSPTPLISSAFGGRTAFGSEDVKWTVPS